MPSTAIQSRISAFESLAAAAPYRPRVASPSPSPPNLGRKTSLLDLKEWVVDDGRTPMPLINLESTSPRAAPPLPPRKPSATPTTNTLTVDHTYPPLKIDVDSRSRNSSGHAPASSISSFHSVSLSSDTDPSTPGFVSSTFPMDSEADNASLAESYEEVSTPSIASPATERTISLDWERAMANRKPVPPKIPQRPSPATSLSSNSIQTAVKSPRQSSSSSAPGSPAFRASISSPSTIGNTSIPRKPPPAPPSRSSDRSSIQSIATSSSHSHSSQSHNSYTPRPVNNVHLKVKRPTPVPPAARARYDAVFDSNVLQQRKAEKKKAKERPALLSPAEARGTSRRAAGWRGLSVDLIMGGDDVPAPASSQDNADADDFVGPTDKLQGHLIKTIWRRSRLGRRTLGEIWNECDPQGTGSLTREQFAKGMWRVDEELRRAQLHALKSTSTASLPSSLRSRNAFKPSTTNKPILR